MERRHGETESSCSTCDTTGSGSRVSQNEPVQAKARGRGREDSKSNTQQRLEKESIREVFLRQVRGENSSAVVPQKAIHNHDSTSTSCTTGGAAAQRSANSLDFDSSTDAFTEATSTLVKSVPVKFKSIKPESRRDTLTEELSKCTFECMVCCGKVYHRQSIWNCQSCYNAFHLHCVKKWSATSAIQGEWRCPGCQNVVNYYPKFYYCYCGKVKNPAFNCSGLPHSCGDSCGKRKNDREDCNHFCTLPCHPGPCEDCTEITKRKCFCGKTTAFVQCQSRSAIPCKHLCNKILTCGLHECKSPCHSGNCQDCSKIINLQCYCGRDSKTTPCSSESNEFFKPKYSCSRTCNKKLNCKNHRCKELCHKRCDPCQTSLEAIVSCPCGQTPIDTACRENGLQPRRSCLDPIPTCGKICNKILGCGCYDNFSHRCVKKCHGHETRCECPLVTVAPCRCGSLEVETPCAKYVSGMEFTCPRRCNKKRSCGRHKCNERCCILKEHICTTICSKMLSCKLHRCDSLCHFGHCKLCPNVSFDELRCECGESVIYPPVACGTQPPPCDQPCSRMHSCEHPVHHQCHSEPNCPPCSFLTEKWCYGKHELRKNIPCWNTNISCGMPCNKPLSCGRHKCPKSCHAGDCEGEEESCKLKCLARIACGHECPSTCHEGECPKVVCRQLTEVMCPCGRRKEVMLCFKREAELESLPAAAAAPDIETNLMTSSVVLKCDKECSRLDRLRKIADALQVHNPDAETHIGPPNYSEFLKKFTKDNPQYVEMIHNRLTSLVMQTKKSTKKNHTNYTYAFDCMNRERRTVVHEYAEHFGCRSESFDEEPNRNVVVTACKEKSGLPSVGLIESVYGKPSSKTERKNVFQDLELREPPKSKIMGPSNNFRFK